MIIQSKLYPDNTRNVTLAEWRKMKEQGIAHRFKVISSMDLSPESGEAVKPIDVVNFMESKAPEVKKVYDRDEVPTRARLKSMNKEDMIESFPKVKIHMDMLKGEMIDKIMLYDTESTESEETGDQSDSSEPGISGEPDTGPEHNG